MPTPNTPTRRDSKKAEMQRRIVQSALKLFRAQGFASTTMEDIAATADVAKRTLYSYFPAKEAIVSAYWSNNVRQSSERLPLLLKNYPDSHSRLVAVFLSAAEGFMLEPEFARIHFSYQFQQLGKSTKPDFHGDFEQFLIAVMETGQREGDLLQDLPANELAQQVMFNFTAICLMWFSDPEAVSLDARLTRAVDCFINGAASSQQERN